MDPPFADSAILGPVWRAAFLRGTGQSFEQSRTFIVPHFIVRIYWSPGLRFWAGIRVRIRRQGAPNGKRAVMRYTPYVELIRSRGFQGASLISPGRLLRNSAHARRHDHTTNLTALPGARLPVTKTIQVTNRNNPLVITNSGTAKPGFCSTGAMQRSTCITNTIPASQLMPLTSSFAAYLEKPGAKQYLSRSIIGAIRITAVMILYRKLRHL